MSAQGPQHHAGVQVGRNGGFPDLNQLLVMSVVFSIALFERREAAITIIDKMRAFQKRSVMYHCSVFFVCWVFAAVSLGSKPRLPIFTCQAVVALLFWGQECLRAVWTQQCHVTHGTLVLSLLSLSARLFTNLKTEAYLPVGWTGEGLYQFMELGTAVIIIVLLFSTVQLHGIRPAPVNGTHTQPPLLIAFAAGLAFGGHLDLAKDKLFDSIWAFSWCLDCFTLIPQVEAIAAGTKSRFHSSSLISLGMYRLLTVCFWIESYQVVKAQKAFLQCSLQIFAGCLLLIMVFISQTYAKVFNSQDRTIASIVSNGESSLTENMQIKEARTVNDVF